MLHFLLVKRHLFITVIFLFVLITHSLAQDFVVNIQQLGTDDGLVERDVQDILIDQEGLLWVATLNYLHRYDGHEFKVYPINTAIAGTNRKIQSIFKDESGWFWILMSGTKREKFRLCFYHPVLDQWKDSEEMFGKDISDKLHPAMTSDFIVGRKSTEPFYYFISQGQLITLNGLKEVHSYPFNLRDKRLSSISLIDKNNNAWIGVNSKKRGEHLIKVSPTGQILTTFDVGFPYTKKDEVIYTGTRALDRQEGVYTEKLPEPYSNDPYKVYKIDNDNQPVHIVDLPLRYTFVDYKDGLIWCIGRKGWKIIRPNGELAFEIKKRESPYDRMLFDGVDRHVFTKDASGNLILPTALGLNIISISKNPFKSYFTNDKDYDLPIPNSTRGIYVYVDTIIANFEYGGLVKLSKDSPEDYELITKFRYDFWGDGTYETLYDGRPLIKTSTGDFYTGHSSNIARWKDINDYSSVNHIIIQKEHIDFSDHCWSLYEDDEGCIWSGHSVLIQRTCADGSSESFVYEQSGFGSNNLEIYQIQKVDNNSLLLCSNRGLFLFNHQSGQVEKYWGSERSNEDFLPAQTFYQCYIDLEGIRWIATDKGLIRQDTESSSYQVFNRVNGLSDNTIYAVYEDDYNQLWMSSNNGIMSFDKSTYEVSSYNKKDGIHELEFNRTSHFKADDGTIYLGGINGITAFHPDDVLKKEAFVPKLVLTELSKFDGSIDRLVNIKEHLLGEEALSLYPDDRFLRLKFTLPVLGKENSILYAWRIEGVYDEWNYQKDNQLQLASLPYGTHNIAIKGRAAGSSWSEATELVIHSVKPFYLQWWFLLFSVLLVVVGIVWYNKNKASRLLREQRELEAKVAKATAQITNDKKIIEQQAEELMELDKMKSKFFANVSHELRTPLTLMMAPISSVLKGGNLSNRNFSYLTAAQRNGKYLLKLVTSILDLSKMETGNLTLYESPQLLFSLVRRVASNFESHCQRKGIQFNFIYNAHQDLQIELDEKKFEIVLNNLLSNAIKFTSSGKKITVIVDDPKSHIMISVVDTGRGIHPDDLPQIFNRFYQSTKDNEIAEGGSGIGLAICQEYLKLMGGQISVDSHLGEGSTFYIKLPRKEVFGVPLNTTIEQDELRTQPVDQIEKAPFSKEKEIILVVEDNYDLRNYLKTILSSDYNILEASNGSMALEVLETCIASVNLNKMPRLILSDIMMPKMDGFQLLKVLKTSSEYVHLPVIMLTARADISDKLKALRIGVDDYILKPFEEEELITRIQNLLANYRKRSRASSSGEKRNSHLLDLNPHDQEWLSNLETVLQKEISNSDYSVAKLAQEVFLSERQLRRRLKQFTGLSPSQYFQEIRMNEARKLLESSTYRTIAEVSIAIGFQNAGSFTRSFIKRYGKKPSDYL